MSKNAGYLRAESTNISGNFRQTFLSAKQSLGKLQEFLSPRKSEKDLGSTTRSQITSIKRGGYTSSIGFIPFESERDNLGNLKNVEMFTDLPSAPSRTLGLRKSQRMSLPKLQMSIHSNLKEEGITNEPVDLRSPQVFKVVDGFERQINIIIRNKEFMKFLKEERDKKQVRSIGFLTQSRDSVSKRKPEEGGSINYDVKYTNVWPKPHSVIIQPERTDARNRRAINERVTDSRPYLDLGNSNAGFAKAPNFARMRERQPLLPVINYAREDSEDMEQKKLDVYFKEQNRPDSVIKTVGPSHNLVKIPKPLDNGKMADLRRELM